MQVYEALNEFLKSNNVGQQEVAQLLGVGQSYVSQMLNGKKPIGKNKADILSKKYGFSKLYLLTGEGEMFRSPSVVASGNTYGDNASGNNNVTISGNNTGTLQARISALQKLIEEKDKQLAQKDELLAERDRLLSEKDKLLAEKDKQLAEKERLVEEKERLIKVLLSGRE